MTLRKLGADAVVRWADTCVDVLWRRRVEIDALNVFPVPDSDTGTNIAHTFGAAAERMRGLLAAHGDAPAGRAGYGADDAAARSSTSELFSALASGAVDGARGNSGAILSQVLLGFAQAAAGDGVAAGGSALDARGMREALDYAAAAARSAVSMPMEGTVLTVLGEAARAAGAAADAAPDGAPDGVPDGVPEGCGRVENDCAFGSLARVVYAASDGAFAALADTTRQLDVLESAGVVDAGGAGLLLILDCLAETVTGETVHRPVFTGAARVDVTPSGAAIAAVDLRGDGRDGPWRDGGRGDIGHGVGERCADGAPRSPGGCPPSPDDYEVMYLLQSADEDSVSVLRRELECVGNSVVIVGDGRGAWSVHVHLQQAGDAVDRGLAAGRIHDVRITHLGVEQSRQQALLPGRGVLAVVNGDGAARLFEQGGAMVLPAQGGASGAAVLDAVAATGAGEVLVLPNGNVPSEDLVVVSAAARRHGQQVLPLPCSAMVQGLASIAVHDPQRPSSDDTYAMAEAAAATRSARLRSATHRALTWAGMCAPGDALGVIGGEVMVVEPCAGTAATTLVDLMLGTGGELVTVLVGAGADDELIRTIVRHAAERHPAVELAVYPGGQPDEVLQIGVE